MRAPSIDVGVDHVVFAAARYELHEHGISAAELARKLNVPTNRITNILNGQRAVPPTQRFASVIGSA